MIDDKLFKILKNEVAEAKAVNKLNIIILFN